jgi:hypothetical protein
VRCRRSIGPSLVGFREFGNFGQGYLRVWAHGSKMTRAVQCGLADLHSTGPGNGPTYRKLRLLPSPPTIIINLEQLDSNFCCCRGPWLKTSTQYLEHASV